VAVSPWTAVVTARTPAATVTLAPSKAVTQSTVASPATKYKSAWAGPVTATTLTGAAALSPQKATSASTADGAAAVTSLTGFGTGGFGQGGFGGVSFAAEAITLTFHATPVTPPPTPPSPTPVDTTGVGRVVVEMGFGTDPTVNGGQYLHWNDTARGIWDSGLWAPDNVWTDVTPWLQSVSWQRGANRVEGPVIRYDEGTATVVLFNDGRFHPLNLSGPYVSAGVSQVRPMLPVRIRGAYGGVWYPLWQGYVTGPDCWQITYPAPDHSIATATCVDAQKVLGSKVRAAQVTPVGEGELSGARVTRILDSASWPTRDRVLDVGASNLQATTLEGDAWSELLLVQDTELGEMYIDPTGKVVFKDRHAILTEPLSTTAQAIFGRYGMPGELPYVSLDPAYDDEDVRNVIRVTREGGIQQETRDDTSVFNYLEKTYEISGLLQQTDQEALDWGNYVLAQSKDADVRFRQLVVNPAVQPVDLWPQVFGRDFGDRITIRSRPPGVGLVERDVFIRGIAGTYTGLNRLQVTWTLQAADKNAGLIWDVSKWNAKASVWVY
jgi:hypothetical protein